MFYCLILSISILLHQSYAFQSNADISNFGYTFAPIDTSVIPLLTCIQRSFVRCYAQCNQLITCRTFDFDHDSGQCRLWSDDLTTGSLLSVPSKPRSKVATIKYTPDIYALTHNQPCAKCVDSRYEVCDSITSTCQCPSLTFWNGSMCLPQRYQNQSCSTLDTCRSDLNLECFDTNCNSIYQCVNRTSVGIGVTVAGFCNGSVGNGSQGLSSPWGLYVTLNNTLYVGDYDISRVQAYPSLSRFGTTVITAGGGLEGVFVDRRSYVYAASFFLNAVFIFPLNITIPKSASCVCNLSLLCEPYGVAGDIQGNVYISDYGCHVIMKWLPNATQGILMFGQMNTLGSNNRLLNGPKGIFLDEIDMSLYVVDFNNNRVQKFMINGNGTGITVAGGNGTGPGLNQLNGPVGVWVSRKDGSIYISDWYNQRVTKWSVNATQSSVVAGVTATPGNSSILLNTPGGIALDPSETYLYVADSANHRVQRFHL